jgi:hypothetical protein
MMIASPLRAAVLSGSYSQDLSTFVTPPAEYGISGDVSVQVDRFYLGNNLSGQYRASITVLYDVAVAIGFGVSTSPNDNIMADNMLILSQPDPRDTFAGVVFGSVNVLGSTPTGDLLPGVETAYTFNATLGQDYYLFVSGAASSLVGPSRLDYSFLVQPVPEPSTYLLFLLALTGLVVTSLAGKRNRK